MDDKPVSEAAAKHEFENGSKRVFEEPSFSSSTRPGSSRSVAFSELGQPPNNGKVHEKTPDTASRKLTALGSDTTSPESRHTTPKSRLKQSTVRVPEKRTQLSEKVRQSCIDANKGIDTSTELEETLVNNFKFFREQDKAVRTELCAHVKFHSMRKDEVVCCEGEICDKFYILLSGVLACFKNLEAEVYARPRGLPKGSSGKNNSYWRRGAMVVKSHMKRMNNTHVDVEYAGSIRPGEVFGDRGLIRRQPHPSTCVCAR
ncbi:hypothetical protein CYMTET_3179 [Cymbomonas tetramitiformis]|uniref:Cyclic nucleotide-binding domain-containing protein n=1 Tax=Cymbomonas tetramitiformis TaxID=36881 RepID=A0AAE0H3R4_9CHLO|nr:hypothetical protein CYMTET_3179 [Cymbomonas tetramitiformis]